MDAFGYIWAGVVAVFQGPAAFSIFSMPVSYALLMVFAGYSIGIVGGATPGLSAPIIMAVSLPILISSFGFGADALLPVLGFLMGVMKGATVGGAVPAILFNTPGTPDAALTTMDGYPMAQRGKAGKALRVAHFSSASGDTFSDIVLFTCAPFLAVFVESYMGFSEKAALIILSLSFIASIVGASPTKGVMAAFLGLFVASIASGEDPYARLSLDTDLLRSGIPLITAVLGVLILGEVFISLETMWRVRSRPTLTQDARQDGDNALTWRERRRLAPFVAMSALIGTIIGALPGVGSTLAATLGYATGRRYHRGRPPFGKGAPEGLAATEAANSAVTGANLIPVLSLGIPGNLGAVFLILAADSIGGFNPGPGVFRFTQNSVNPELVVVFGLFTMMMLANVMNWVLGSQFMRHIRVMGRVPKQVLMPLVLLTTITSVYLQTTDFNAVLFLLGFGFLGYAMRKFAVPTLPFVIAYVLAENLEDSIRQAYSASGSDPFFIVRSPLSVALLLIAFGVLFFFTQRRARTTD